MGPVKSDFVLMVYITIYRENDPCDNGQGGNATSIQNVETRLLLTFFKALIVLENKALFGPKCQ